MSMSRNHLWIATAVAVGALLVACASVNRPHVSPTASAPGGGGQAGSPPLPAPAAVPPPVAILIAPMPTKPNPSIADSPKAYRRDAAVHLYAGNEARIYHGVMQPNLYAIGVLEVDIDREGKVTAVRWRRAPTHAPEVMAEIVRTVRAAAPYPIPSRLGKVTYTDIWLWDKSGKFQLDTLTEGQL
ncbi:MAG: hypothetical protein ABI343_18180 [Burkholderiaceae bacterium]